MLLLFVWAILSVDWLFPDKFSLEISNICCFPVFLKIAKIINKNRNQFHDNLSLSLGAVSNSDDGGAVMVLHSSRFLVLSMISTSLIFNS